MSAFAQNVLVGLVLLLCLWRLCAQWAPALVWRWQARMAYFLETGQRPRWLRLIARSLRPMPISLKGCGSGCAPCGGCERAKT
jgi:hypothetical protein